MNQQYSIRKSKKISWLLRHGAYEAQVEMDKAGWVAVADVLRVCKLSRRQLNDIVARNNKKRLKMVGDQIRAVQGHSTEGTPVTAEAMEDSWTLFTGVQPVFHGTFPRALQTILQQGILPMARTHVHLAESENSTVGKRANVGVLISVCPVKQAEAGAPLYVSDNGVLLCRRVLVSAIIGLKGLTKNGRAAVAAAQLPPVAAK